MQQSLEKLRKFFRLEHGNGYNNTAIIGGLARMLDYWEGEARADGLTEDTGDAGLDQVMGEIDLRVAVELAKAGVR
jgi:hypothetical protein